MTEQPCVENTDTEIWRERPADYYSDSIHVTQGGGIGINCGGKVYVKPLRVWFAMAEEKERADSEKPSLPAARPYPPE